MSPRAALARGRRLVVKVGSGVLSNGGARLDAPTLRRLARELSALRAGGREVLVVSSGAILAGWEGLGLERRPTSTQLKQAAAAVGQSRLMRVWEAAFGRQGLRCAQVLLTREDLHHRQRYLNARNTLLTLLRHGVVPIINENDTVAVEEIRFGDNDVLSALVAGLCDASGLILLTDQDGLYSSDPRLDAGARLEARVACAQSAALERSLKAAGSGPHGSGGMASKAAAARMASSGGIPTVIANGLKPGTLACLAAGEEVGTLFEPRAKPLDKRAQWLAYAAHPKGSILVDEGAREALARRSKSLLPSGVRGVAKVFEAGDVVSLVSGGQEFARGLSNYDSKELERVKGLKTSEIEAVLGYKPADEVVHRDNLALLGEAA